VFEEPESNKFAVVTRKMGNGSIEVVAIHFEDEEKGFANWVKDLPEQVTKVDTGGKVVKLSETIEGYEPHTKANTIAVFYGPRTSMVYSWDVSDMAWSYMKHVAMERPQEKRQGRPPKLVQPLQTWRKWSKKENAPL
jgi:hypothetical protein